jgi:hypothetical protein
LSDGTGGQEQTRYRKDDLIHNRVPLSVEIFFKRSEKPGRYADTNLVIGETVISK